MSVFGISPTDVVNAGYVVKKAVAALSPGEDGAKKQYQKAEATISSRQKAAADLSSSAPSAHAAVQALDELFACDQQLRDYLKSYSTTLGRNGKRSWYRNVNQKLQYAFAGAAKVQEHISTSQPGVDAAILHFLRLMREQYHQYHTQTIEKIDGVAQGISADISSFMDLLAQNIAQLLNSTTMKLHSDLKEDLERILKTVMRESLPQPMNLGTRTPRCLTSLSGKLPQQTKPESTTDSVPATKWSSDFHALVYRVLLSAIAASSAILYQNLAVRKVIAASVKAYHRDPVSLSLLLLVIGSFINCFFDIPSQISLLSGDCISLETALGETLKVPSCHWASFDIFHGFLTTHFATKPGVAYVRTRQYRILLGGGTGQILDIDTWQKVIFARMKLVMALVLNMDTDSCPRCRRPFKPCQGETRYCQACNKHYRSICPTTDYNSSTTDLNEHPEDPFVQRKELPNEKTNAWFCRSGTSPSGEYAEAPEWRASTTGQSHEVHHFVHILLSGLPMAHTAWSRLSISKSDGVFNFHFRAGLPGGHRTVRSVVDTGSNCNLISERVFIRLGLLDRLEPPAIRHLKVPGFGKVPVMGRQNLWVTSPKAGIRRQSVKAIFEVVPESYENFSALLGCATLARLGFANLVSLSTKSPKRSASSRLSGVNRARLGNYYTGDGHDDYGAHDKHDKHNNHDNYYNYNNYNDNDHNNYNDHDDYNNYNTYNNDKNCKNYKNHDNHNNHNN